MKVVSVATADSRVYYEIVSRLKEARIKFSSLVPPHVRHGDRFVITSKSELVDFSDGVAIEDLSRDPLVMKGQVYARMSRSPQELLIGVDPGSKMGVMVFYGDADVGSFTSNFSVALERIISIVNGVPNSRARIKIGNGAPTLSRSLARELADRLARVEIEVVDESGTSSPPLRAKGGKRDQVAAARIALRKGSRLIAKAS